MEVLEDMFEQHEFKAVSLKEVTSREDSEVGPLSLTLDGTAAARPSSGTRQATWQSARARAFTLPPRAAAYARRALLSAPRTTRA